MAAGAGATPVEARLFVFAEQVLVEVLGRIRDQDRDIVVPARFDLPGIDGDAPLGRVVEAYLRDDAAIPAALGAPVAGAAVARAAAAGPGGSDQAAVVRVAEQAVAAAGRVVDGTAVARTPYGELAVRDYLLRLAVSRSLLAHYVAAYLGSTACPLPEELARPLWELTAADAHAWRERGAFFEPLPIPAQASWRDVFLRTAGHEPHPLGH